MGRNAPVVASLLLVVASLLAGATSLLLPLPRGPPRRRRRREAKNLSLVGIVFVSVVNVITITFAAAFLFSARWWLLTTVPLSICHTDPLLISIEN
jgi:hypothetical protein